MNNFDQSSTGVNIELLCHWDADLSHIWADECFHTEWYEEASLLNDRYSRVTLYQYVDHGNIKPLNLICESSYDCTKNDIKEALIGEWGIEELRDQAQFRFDKNFSQLTKTELFDLVCELAYDAEEAIKFYYDNLTARYTVISCRGYCQGDYIEVVIPHTLADVWGTELTEQRIDDLAEQIGKLAYDSPLFCRVEVDGEEYDLTEQVKDLYNYDKEELIGIAKNMIEHNKKDLIINWLNDNLHDNPCHLGYC